MMKFLIVYSSRTGNTRQVAEALYAAAPDGSTISNVETAPAADGYDVIFVGYWMDRGTADEKSKAYLRTLTKKKVVLFETMGASPASEHAYTGFANAATCLSEGNTIMGVLAIQGAVDPALIAMMRKMPAGSAHNTGEMEKTTEEAAKHPDAADLEKAKAYMEAFMAKYEKYYGKIVDHFPDSKLKVVSSFPTATGCGERGDDLGRIYTPK